MTEPPTIGMSAGAAGARRGMRGFPLKFQNTIGE
jgi:hypothetical protein